MKYRIVHETAYNYGETVSLCHNEARITPRRTDRQTCASRRIFIDPSPAAMRDRTDFFGNRVTYFAIQTPHDAMTVQAESDVEIRPLKKDLNLDRGPDWQTVRRRLAAADRPDLLSAAAFVLDSPHAAGDPALNAYARPSFPPGRALPAAVHDLMNRIYADFEFQPGFTTIATPLSEVMETRRGVCQDFAHLAIGCLRSLGLSARYVSGYIETLPPPGKEKLTGVDASHAWFSVYCPENGWTDFDPTNNQLPDTRHITVAWGRDYADVAPLKGVIFSAGDHQLTVSVDVQRLEAD